MIEVKLPTRADKIKPGDRIAINAVWAINPSLTDYRIRRVPMTCDVAYVRNLGTSVVIESIAHYCYELPSGYIIDRLCNCREELDMKPLALPAVGQTYNNVSID